jgi:hypothetical protein
MNPELRSILLEAILAYDYPAVTYDFADGCERQFSTIRELDTYLQGCLHSDNMQNLTDGLSGIFYWGHYRAGYRDYRVARFRSNITDVRLQRAVEIFPKVEGAGLMALKTLGLPEFSNMAFTTKLRMFLDPEHYCVLDKKIATLAPLASRLRQQPTFIPVNEHNQQAYRWWVDACSSLASQIQNFRPVDVERGFFCLIEREQIGLAERLLSDLTTRNHSAVPPDDSPSPSL